MSLLLCRRRMALPYSRVLWPEPRPLPWKEYALTGFSIICDLIIIMIVLFCGGDCDIYLKCFLRMMNSPLRHRLSWWSLGELELRAPGFDDYLAFQRFDDYLAFQHFDDYLDFQHRSKFDPEIRWVFLRCLNINRWFLHHFTPLYCIMWICNHNQGPIWYVDMGGYK